MKDSKSPIRVMEDFFDGNFSLGYMKLGAQKFLPEYENQERNQISERDAEETRNLFT